MTYAMTAEPTTMRASRSERIPAVLNLKIASAIGIAHLYIFIFLPLYLLPVSAWWGLTLIPFFFMHSAQWGLIHEAIHKNLHPDRTVNEYAGRALSILMGVSYHVLSYGHLMHHKLNRDWETEIIAKRDWRATTMYYVTLLGGLYIKEIVGGLLLALFPPRLTLPETGWSFLRDPQARQTCRRYFFEKGNVKPLRYDVALATALHIMALYFYGAHALLFAAFLLSRAWMISFMDNIYHYGTTHDEVGKDLALSPWASGLLLHSNYHRVHHTNPSLPWTALPDASNGFDGRFLEHGLQQFNGPILQA